ncbi:hypothetical protein [Tessaracoccus sp. MC1756]|uniref:hypothetical protein n=1 Tax=Tessaracoccus sp. MC1756 TaxID=2760311 RepID=UPI00351BFAE2
MKLWSDAWAEFVPFLQFDKECRRRSKSRQFRRLWYPAVVAAGTIAKGFSHVISSVKEGAGASA